MEKCKAQKIGPGEVIFINAPIPEEIEIRKDFNIYRTEGGCNDCVVKGMFNCATMTSVGWCSPGFCWQQKIKTKHKLIKKIGFK